MTTRVLLADDHRMFREALCMSLATEPDLEIVAEAGSGTETMAAIKAFNPAVVVLDIGLPDMSGVQVARQVSREFPAVRVVALSGHADRLFVDEMLRAGARGYVVKSAGTHELVNAIRAAVAGHAYLSPEVTGTMLRQALGEAGAPPPLTVLGQREQEVLRLLANGKRSAEIATVLGISPNTVDVHRRNIKQKLNLHTTAELTRYAIREGLHSI